ncbi:TetR/AcrR family transcriptional regulator [Arthrobacter psychrolactophilus]
MRADAARNVEKLRGAAVEIFRKQGLHVSLREIASQAGVSHGTLYNLFGSREALINAVVTDLAAARLEEIAAESLAIAAPWDGFVHYANTVCEVQVAEPALADVLSGRYPEAETLMALCARAGDDSLKIIDRAQQDGTLRLDFTGEDLALTIGAIASLARAGGQTAPGS